MNIEPPSRRAIPALAAAVVLAGSPASAQPKAAPHPDFTGVWAMKFVEYVHMDDGKLPPMRPEAMARYQQRVAKLQAGEQLPDSTVACLPHGMPRIMYTPYPVQILQKDDVVGFMFEVNHNARLAYFGEKPPEDPDPTYMGYSIAHWEGDTLVIETTGLNDKIQVDRAGLPQSPKTRLVEHMRLLEGGKRLEEKITVIDDTLYTAPWSFTVTYAKAAYHVMEYVCDNNRDLDRIRNNQ
jgi:hypothetical protein